MSSVLVINSGSSSFKYQLIDTDSEQTLASGLVERIGEENGHTVHKNLLASGAVGGGNSEAKVTERELEIEDHTHGFQAMLDAFRNDGPSLAEYPPAAVGHRVVHGGKRFFEPVVLTHLVKINIEDLTDLAPLHNPANLEGIEAAEHAFPDVPHVAVFDTAFHQTLPPKAYTYAIDRKISKRNRFRRYGFHGTSHKFVSEEAAKFLGQPLDSLKQLVLHLGNGASITAIDQGKSVETSMGFTPLEGLVMGTRSGDLDPAILLHLQRRGGLSVDEVDNFLNHKSGLLGLAGANDMRDVQSKAADGDEAAQLALDVYLHRIKGYVGNYFAQLGDLDVISFTAGVGENSPLVRRESLAGLERLGIEIDRERNESRGGPKLISTDASKVKVLVVPTNEELEIARQTISVVRRLSQ